MGADPSGSTRSFIYLKVGLLHLLDCPEQNSGGEDMSDSPNDATYMDDTSVKSESHIST